MGELGTGSRSTREEPLEGRKEGSVRDSEFQHGRHGIDLLGEQHHAARAPKNQGKDGMAVLQRRQSSEAEESGELSSERDRRRLLHHHIHHLLSSSCTLTLLVVVVFDRVCASTAMGFGRKVGEGGVSRWLLLLAGVLLAVAVTVTAGDAAEEGATAGDYTFGAVEEGATAGKDSLHGSRAMCELKCQHHQDPVNKQRCIDFCIRWQLALLFDVKEEDGATTTDAITAGEDGICASRRICKLKCQHHHDTVNNNRCVDFCIRYQLALHDINDGATAAAAGGAIRQVV
uniref:Plant antimicrobial peptide domain-containing protein n=1 Tax=Setaria italica TaxID=4555 RepID=K3ZJG8_SETIT